MKRPMTLTALIMNLSMPAITSVVLMVLMAKPGLLVTYFDSAKQTAIYVFLGVFLASALALIVLSAIAINVWNKPKKIYIKKQMLILVAILMDFVCVSGAIILAFFKINSITMLIVVFEILIGLASATLLIIDICLENKRNTEKSEQHEKQEEKKIVVNPKPAVESKEKLEKIINKQAVAQKTQLEEKLEKLADMKSRGLIDDAEYKELKFYYIKQMMK